MSDRPFLPSDLDYYTAAAAKEFVRLCQARAVRAAGGGEAASDRWLRAVDAGSRVDRLIKAGVPAATTGTAGYAGDIAADFRNVVGAFSETLRSTGFFFALLADGFVRVPMRTRAGIISLGATAFIVGEGRVKPISRVTVANQEIAARKAVGIMVATKELITAVGPAGQQLFERELRNSVALAVDEEALRILLTGVTPTPSGGTDFAAAAADLAALLGAIETKGGPVVLIAARDVALAAGLLTTPSGGFAFTTPGQMGGLPVYVSDAVDPGMLIAVNCAAVAADADEIAVSASTQAAVEMADAALVQDGTTGTGTNLVSLWQDNAVGLRVEVAFGLEKIRDDGVAAISGVSWTGAA